MYKIIFIVLCFACLLSASFADDVEVSFVEQCLGVYQYQWRNAGMEYSIDPLSTIHVDITNIHSSFGSWEGSNWVQVQSIAPNDTIYVDDTFKGAGSHLTTMRFLIREDSTSTTMSEADCRKDAILISGFGILPNQLIRNIGIEDLKIERIRNGISEGEVKDYVGGHDTEGTQGEGITEGVTCYWGNNIAIRRATDCWVKGVASEST